MADNNGNNIKNKLAKGAATVAGGPLAGKAVDLADDKLGSSLHNKNDDLLAKQSSNRKSNLGETSNSDSSGNSLDALPKDGLNSTVEDSPEVNDEIGQESYNQSTLGKVKDKLSGGGSTTAGSDGLGSALMTYLSKHKIKIAGAAIGAVLAVLLLFGVYVAVASVGGTVIEFFTKIGDSIVGFFQPDEQELIEKYYAELDKVKKDRKINKNVCIDENLITATLTVHIDAQDYANSEESEKPPEEDLESDVSAISDVDYKKMTKEVGLLANMQIVTKRYGMSKKLVEATPPVCPEESIDELVTEENLDDLYFPTWWQRFITRLHSGESKAQKYVSDDPFLVSTHDLTGFAKFFKKKVNEETNFEYHIYTPAVEEVCHTGTNGTRVCQEECHPDHIPEDDYALSIGDLQTMEESVYYWNLVNSFIPEYYDEYLPPEEKEEERDKAIKKIAEDIYLLYKDLGKGEACDAEYQNYICRSDEGASYYSVNDGSDGSEVVTNSDFIDRLSAIAIEIMNLTGRDASVLIAQAIDESGWGQSGLSSRYSNYFGVSAGCVDSSISDPNEYRGQVLHAGEGGNHCSGNAYWNGDAVSLCSTRRCAWRRVYDSLENSAYDYATLSNYRECNQYASPYDQISCIKANGYAQDEEYVEKIMGLINSYNLTQYDIGHWDGTLLDSSGQPARYINRTCRYSADGTQYGDWANWKQGQGPWADQYIGNKTIGQVGCLVTSIAIQIQRSGVATILGDDFNPGTFVQAIKDYGPGFSNNSLNSRDVSNIAPDFKYQGNYQYTNVNTLASVVNQPNTYVVLDIHHPGEHHVAIDRVENGNIYMFDPGNYGDELFSAFGNTLSIDGYSVYKVGG